MLICANFKDGIDPPVLQGYRLEAFYLIGDRFILAECRKKFKRIVLQVNTRSGARLKKD